MTLLNPSFSFYLLQLRQLCSRQNNKRTRRRFGRPVVCRTSVQPEALEQRQLLVMPPGLPTVSSAQGLITIQWVQPSQDPARSFDIAINRIDLVAGGPQLVVQELSMSPTVLAGSVEIYSVRQPLAAGNYSVSVVARGFDGSVSTASLSNFTLGQLTPQMLTISGKPFSATTANRPQVGRSVNLEWAILPGVQDYYLWIGKKVSGTFVQIANTTPQALKGGSYDVFLAPGEYQVKVRNLNDLVRWSPTVDFEVTATQSTVPVWTSTSTSLAKGAALSWTPVPLASSYRVELTGAVTATTIVATSEYRGTFLLPGTYTARVQAADVNGRFWGWSAPVSFTVTSTTYRPQLTSSPGGSQINGVRPVIWNPVTWASSYEVTVQTVEGMVVFKERTRSTHFEAPLLPPTTNYKVTVRAMDSISNSAPVHTGSFGITSETYKPQQPTVTQRADGMTAEWARVFGAIAYDVWVDRIAGNGFTARPQLIREFAFAESFRLGERLQEGATYRIWVKPRFANNVPGPNWSSFREFTVDRSAALQMVPGTDPTQPRFQWNEFPDAVSYRFRLINKSVTPHIDAIMPVSGLTRASFGLPSPLPAGTYSATVEILFPGNQNLMAQSLDFTVPPAAAATLPAQIKILQQADGPTVVWSAGQTGIYDIRIATVNSDSSTREAIREQSRVFTTGLCSHLIKGGLAPGLYRVDVGVRPSPSAVPAWSRGPIFSFDGNAINPLLASGIPAAAPVRDVKGPFVADVDGDGDMDIIRRNADDGPMVVMTNDATTLTTSTWSSSGPGGFIVPFSSTSGASLLTGDFNGDGRDDIVQPQMENGSWPLLLSRPASVFETLYAPINQSLNPDLPSLRWNNTSRMLSWSKLQSPNELGSRSYEVQVVRNGTGSGPSEISAVALAFTKSDAINNGTTISESMASLADGEYSVFVRTTLNGRLSQWSSAYAITVASNPVNTKTSWWNYLVGDFNGDRRDDIAVFNLVRQQWNVYLSTGTSFEQAVWTDGVELKGIYNRPVVLDFNGDGRQDILIKDNQGTGSWSVHLSAGTSFVTQQLTTPAFMQEASVGWSPWAADVDADGKDDVVLWHGNNLRVVFSRGSSLSESAGGQAWTAVSGMPGNTVPFDMNADGKTDLIGFDANGISTVAIATATGFIPQTPWSSQSLGTWVKPLSYNAVTVADFNYRSRSVRETVDRVRNTIEFEGYRGLRKGVAGTEATKSGNAWDQADLLGSLLSNPSSQLTDVRYVTGRMRITESQAKEWLGTTHVSMDWFSAAGLNPSLAGGTLEIDHAWIQALMPTATGLGWVDINPSLKTMLVADPVTVPALFTSNELKALIGPAQSSFSADFDAGGATTQHDLPSIPPQVNFISGGGNVVTDPAWPKLGSPANISDYKIATAYGTPANMAIGSAALNGEISANVAALYFKQNTADGTTLQDFRVYGRATNDYEVGFQWSEGTPGILRLYQRNGREVTPLALTVDSTTAPLSEFTSFAPFSTAGYLPTHVRLLIDDMTITAYVQYSLNGVVTRRKLVAILSQPSASNLASVVTRGRFGISVEGPVQHWIDNINFVGKDVVNVSPLSWLVDQRLHTSGPVTPAAVSSIGGTRQILYSVASPVALLISSAGSGTSIWNSDAYQTATLSFAGRDGGTVQITRPAGGPQTTPNRIADLSRKRIVVRTGSNGRTANLFIDDVLYETATLSSVNGNVLTLKISMEVPGSVTEPPQTFRLPTVGSTQIVLRAGQYAASDLGDASDALADAYDQIPVDSDTGKPAGAFNGLFISEHVRNYAVVRLLTDADRVERDISRLTEALLVRPIASAGLISSADSVTFRLDSVYYATPTDLTIDFPAGKLRYVPRNGSTTSIQDPAQQSRALLTMVELAALEDGLLSELTDKPAMSALTFLSFAQASSVNVRRLSKNASGQYFDQWNSGIAPTSTLSSFLNFGTGTYRTAALNKIREQLDAGGTVTVSQTFRTVNGWTGIGWLHERYSGNPAPDSPLIDSLLMSDADGSVLHGGVLGSIDRQATSDASLQETSTMTSDAYQGILRKSDTDFTISIPGLSIPFTRTWTSSRSDASTVDRVVNVTDLSDFGSGWMHPFAQQLEIATTTKETVRTRTYRNIWLQKKKVDIKVNADRQGEAALIAWRRPDGTTGLFTANGSTGTSTADYTSPEDMPGVMVRRFDGAATGNPAQVAYGDSYSISMPDGSVYGFRDYNTVATRITGFTNAYLTSITDRFGNAVEILRSSGDPSRIDSVREQSTGRTLLRFRYMMSVAETTKGGSGIVEKQTLSMTPVGTVSENDRLVLSFGGHLTESIPRYPTEAAVKAALEGLPTIGVGQLTVTQPVAGSFIVSFSGTKFAGQDVPSIGTVISRIEVGAANSGDAPAVGVSGVRIWDYRYDWRGQLSKVLLSEATGPATAPLPTAPVARYAYTWNYTPASIQQLTRGDRMAKLMRSAASYTGTATDNGQGLSTTFEYYGNGRLRTVRDSSGAETRLIYNAFSGVTTTIDAQGGVARNRYSGLGDLLESISPAGDRTVFDVSSATRLVTASYSTNGQKQTWLYDTAGRMTKETTPSGVSRIVSYGSDNQILTVDEQSTTGVIRRLQTNVYSTTTTATATTPGAVKGALASTTDALLNVTTFTYNLQGLLAERLSPRGHSVKFDSAGFDSFGNPRTVEYRAFQNGVWTTQSVDESIYDNTGRLDYVLDYDASRNRSRKTDFTYDPFGRLITSASPDPYLVGAALTTQYQYGRDGRLERRIDPDGAVYRFEYDSVGQMIRHIMPDGTFTSTEYNSSGTVAATIDANGNRTRFFYDALNRLVQTVNPDGSSSVMIYDANGNLIRQVDPRGFATTYEHDLAGRVTKSTDAAGNETLFRFDGFGNQTTAETSVQRVTNTFNHAHQIIQALFESKVTASGTVSYVKERVDHFFYDANGNMERTDSLDLRYDAVIMTATRISTLTDANVTKSEADSVDPTRKRITSTLFDFQDRPVASINAAGGVTATVLNADGLATSISNVQGQTTEFGYDLAGWQSYQLAPFASISDTSGLATVTRRDSMGRVVESRNSAYTRDLSGAVVLAAGSLTGEPSAPPDALTTRSTKTVYDVLGRAIATQNAMGFLTRVTYDPAGNVVETIDAGRRSTLNVYDDMGRVIRQVVPVVNIVGASDSLNPASTLEMPTVLTAYDLAGNVTTTTDPAGRVTNLTYDAMNRVISKSLPAVVSLTSETNVPTVTVPVVAYTYDSAGNVARETDLSGRVTSYVSDIFGRVIRTTLPDPDSTGPLVGTVQEAVFDAFGNRITEIDRGNPAVTTDDRITTHEYNVLNLKTKTTLPDPDGVGTAYVSPALQWQYDSLGNLTASIDALNRTTLFEYDRLNRRTTTKLPEVSTGTSGTVRPTSTVNYDLFGSVVSTVDALGRVTRFENDALGRTVVTRMPHPSGTYWNGHVSPRTEVTFDAVGNVIQLTDQLGRSSTTAFDRLNRPIRITAVDAALNDNEIAGTSFTFYDINGNLSRTTDILGRQSRFEYDALNRQVLAGAWNGSGWDETRSWFDASGNVTRTQDVRGFVTDITYNGWNQVLQVQLPAADANGRPTTTNAYDQQGRLQSVTDPRGSVTQFFFDNLNRTTRKLLPLPAAGVTRPESLFVYDAVGNLIKEQVLVSRSALNVEVWTETVRTLDALNRVLSTSIRPERVPDGQTPVIQTLTSQTYDLAGNILSSTDAEQRVTGFEYDRLNRLVTTTQPKPAATGAWPVFRTRYDEAGNKSASVDPLGRITTYSYDRLNRLLTTTLPDPDGPQGPLPAPTSTSVYDQAGRVVASTDHLGRTTSSVYNLRGQLVQVTQPDPDLTDGLPAPSVTFVYDAAGNKLSSTDARGNTTDYVYDALNRLTTTLLPDANPMDRLGRAMLQTSYDLAGNIITQTDAYRRVTDFAYDRLNRVTQIVLPDPDGLSIGWARARTTFGYNAVGNKLKTTEFSGVATVSRITDQSFDFMGRLVQVTSSPPTAGVDRPVTIYEYDQVGNQTSVTQTSTSLGAIQKTTRFAYDNLSRLVQTQSPHPVTGAVGGGPVSGNTYDLAGRLIASTDAMNRVTTYTYDELDRQIRVVGADPNGTAASTTSDTISSEVRTTYDAAGNIAATDVRRLINPSTLEGSTASVFSATLNRYDDLNRLTSVVDANGGISQFRYDANGQRTMLIDPTFNVTRWQFDSLGQVVAETDPLGNSTVFQFDIAGNLSIMTDRRGYQTQYVRNKGDQLLREQWLQPSGTDTAFISQFENWYDNYGRLKGTQQRTMATGAISTVREFLYDDLERITSVDTKTTAGQRSAKLAFAYDIFGNRSSRIQHTGTGAAQVRVTTNYLSYDYLNQLTTLSQTASNFAGWQSKSVRLDYLADGSLSSTTRYSDAAFTNIVLQTSYANDDAGRLTSLSHSRSTPASNLPITYSYRYLADGRLMEEVSSVDGASLKNYDSFGQLVGSTRAGSLDETYSYDASGNRQVAGTIIGKGNRIFYDGTFRYLYDAEGSLTEKTRVLMAQGSDIIQESTKYFWDHRNRLTKVEFYGVPGSGTAPLLKTVEYAYNDSDVRISKKVTVTGQTPVSENYVWDGSHLVAVMNATGTITHQYFDGQSLDEVFADQTTVSGILWPVEDRAGTVRDVINTSGATLDHRTLTSFGALATQTGATIDYDHFQSGMFWDVDSQLYYARARWYDPTAGRFIGEDPLGFGGGDLNISRYANNDPVNFSDPTGLFSFDIGKPFKKLADKIGDVFSDVGDFAEKQWENGNIQKGLLVAGTLASGGMLGFGLAAGSLGTAQIFAGAMGVSSGLANSYEVFSGDRIGDGTFTRVLGATAAVTGGFFAPGVSSFGTFGRGLSGASGLVSGYEIASGNTIGDGTFSSLFHVSNLGVNQGSTLFNSTASAAQRFSVGLNLAVGGASLVNTGDRNLQQALRSLSIASGVWNTGSSAITAYHSTRATLQALRPTPVEPLRRRNSGNIRQVNGVEENSSVGMGDVKAVERRMDHEDPRIQAFWDHLAYEEILNGPPKSRAEVYADMEAQAQADPRNAAAIRAMLKSTMEYDRSQSEDYMYGSDKMAASHQNAQQQAVQVFSTIDQYTLHAMSAMVELNDGITYAINKDTYYSSFELYDSARRTDDGLMMAADPLFGLSSIFSNTYDPIVARMDREQSFRNYQEYRSEGYDPSRDPGQAKGMLVTWALLAAAEPIGSELASDIFVEMRAVARNGKNFASTLDANRIFNGTKALWADEAGTIQTGYGAFAWGKPTPTAHPASRIVPGGGLTAHEKVGGHLLAKHLGLTDSQLAARLAAEPRISGSSSFGSRTLAESGVSAALNAEQPAIKSWLSGSGSRMVVNHNTGNNVGRTLSRGAPSAVDSQAVRVVLQRDASFPGGFRIITGFPTP
jgi:RHS repeat-associated protein